MSPSAGSWFCYWWFFNLIFYSYIFFLGACSISSNCDASWDTAADRNWSVWMQRLISASTHFMPTHHPRYRSFLVFFRRPDPKFTLMKRGECTFPAGIPTNPAKPAGYSVRMEASVPLVTQAPPIQPLQIRPGVITQVKNMAIIKMRAEDIDAITLRDALLLRGGLVNTYDRQYWDDNSEICLPSLFFLFFWQINRPGPTVHSRSWCPLGSRWHQCPRLRRLLTPWWDHRDWLIGGKPFIAGCRNTWFSVNTYLLCVFVLDFVPMLSCKANVSLLVMNLCTPLGGDGLKWCNTFALLNVNDQWVIGVLWDRQRDWVHFDCDRWWRGFGLILQRLCLLIAGRCIPMVTITAPWLHTLSHS